MADQNWDTPSTRIGSKARGPGSGGVDRERVVKGKSAINAAQRSGAIIGTEKKYAGSNAASGGTEGQLLTKVDRSDEIIPLKEVGKEVGAIVARRRNEITPKLTQKELATKVNSTQTIIQSYENGKAVPDQALLGKMERILGVKLRGSNIGSPLGPGPKKK